MAILCVPWGGAFGEYTKLLQLLANRHTRRVIASTDDNLEVVPEGPVLKMMVAAGLLRELRQSYLDSHWSLAVPVVNWDDCIEAANSLPHLARRVSKAVLPGISQVIDLMKSGRYAGMDGVGDYLEMAYSVLLGKIVEWSVDEGLLRRTPVLKTTRNSPVLGGAKRDKHVAMDPLPGICVLKNSASAWSWVKLQIPNR